MITVYIIRKKGTDLYQGRAYWGPFGNAEVFQEWQMPQVLRGLKYESERYGEFEWEILQYDLTETP
jgi:hypothetical protein